MDMINKILEFMKEAGDIAIKLQSSIDLSIQQEIKDDNVYTVVTKADIDISNLFNKFIRDNFSNLDHIIIDEEKVSDFGLNPIEKIRKTEYSFVIDPIDGTQPFALKMPLYGISVGVLKYGKPYLGVVYCPAVKELAYFDGEKSYWVQNAFCVDEKKALINPNLENRSSFVLEHPWSATLNDKIDLSKEVPVGVYSAVMSMFYVITGRARAWYFKVYLWDIAGAWPILDNLGFKMMNYNTGTVLEVSEENFDSKIRIKDVHIVCKPNNFEHYKNIAEIRR